MKYFVLIGLGLTLSYCEKINSGACNPKTTEEGCVCVQVYDPVCGCDNVTYSNSCEAECMEVSYTPGACK